MVFDGVPVIWVNSVQVTSGQNGDYTRLAQDFTGIDRENARVSDRASQQLRIGHAVQPDVARKDGPARDLGHAVFARNRMIDDAELPVLHANLFTTHGRSRSLRLRASPEAAPCRACAPRALALRACCRIRPAARRIALRIGR